jgi:hypothetical protein
MFALLVCNCIIHVWHSACYKLISEIPTWIPCSQIVTAGKSQPPILFMSFIYLALANFVSGPSK